jgi:cell division protein FtsQ
MAALLSSLVAASVWAAYTALDGRATPVRTVVVDGEFRYLSRARLEREVLEALDGGFFRADLGAIRRAVAALPWVERVAVRRVWPGRLEVTVKERRPAARWGRGGFVDGNGEHFVPPLGSAPGDLPLLGGPEGTQARVLELYRRLLAELAPAGLTPVEVRHDARRALTVDTAQGVRLVFGRVPVEAGLARLLRSLPVVRRDGAAAGRRPERIDLRYPNGLAVAWSAPQNREEGSDE